MDVVSTQPAGSGWKPVQVYAMATVCLVIGLAVGYLFRGSAGQKTPPPPVATQAANGAQPMPSLEQMKHMADKQAEPLLQQLKAEPKNADLLLRIGNIYKSTHQFNEALGYYRQSVDASPRSAIARTELASCLYYTGDVDGALEQLQQSLKDDPGNVNALFNLGVIRWQTEKDNAGAIKAWQELLKRNPRLEPDKRSKVEKLIAQVGAERQ